MPNKAGLESSWKPIYASRYLEEGSGVVLGPHFNPPEKLIFHSAKFL